MNTSVLILLMLELTLWWLFKMRRNQLLICLNPSDAGIDSLIQQKKLNQLTFQGLNPSDAGIDSLIDWKGLPSKLGQIVLILLMLELTLWCYLILIMKMQGWTCLNPSDAGIDSLMFSITHDHFIVRAVLILLMLELTLWWSNYR